MYIRAYRDDDFPSIAEIYDSSKLDELVFEEGPFELLPLERDEKRLKETMESTLYVYEDGEILGYGAVFGNEIRALFVHPSFRGKGVGKKLLDHLITQAETPATLHVAKSNRAAKSIYQKHGFRVTEEYVATYDGKQVLANVMVKET
ncbi:MAG: GNAT family N-acetyltransferase [Saccharospirillum sp.]|nr:GNAT family N-acetyltransferase [Saccharospirillum sp.]